MSHELEQLEGRLRRAPLYQPNEALVTKIEKDLMEREHKMNNQYKKSYFRRSAILVTAVSAMLIWLFAFGGLQVIQDSFTPASPGVENGDENDKPYIEGFVTSIDPEQQRILVVQLAKENGFINEKSAGWFSVNDETKLLDTADRTITLAQLQIGQIASIWIDGFVLESYPVQGTAEKIKVVNADTQAMLPLFYASDINSYHILVFSNPYEDSNMYSQLRELVAPYLNESFVELFQELDRGHIGSLFNVSEDMILILNNHTEILRTTHLEDVATFLENAYNQDREKNDNNQEPQQPDHEQNNEVREPKYNPVVDKSHEDPALVEFLRNLQAIVKNKDHDSLLSLVMDDVVFSYGLPYSKEEFVRFWQLDNNPIQSPIWRELHNILSLGGDFVNDDLTFYAMPYIFVNFPTDIDQYQYGVILQEGVLVYDKPNGQAIGEIDTSIVKLNGRPSDETVFMEGFKYPFIPILTADEKEAYVIKKYIRSPLDYRLGLMKENNQWIIRYLVSGD